ncbi:MAG TPA: protein kinase [Isosphaeraceae bacterium]
MPPRPPDCDPDRLRRLLDDRLDDAEQSAMGEHLASCDGCRHTLDRMAAGTRWWREARAFLAPDHEATAAVPHADRPETDPLDFLAPSDDPAHLGRIGPYEVVDVIGRGGMGVVLKALDPSLNRFVAIKVLAPELATSASARRRFAREGQAAAAICHDHVVAIHAVDASGGLPYLVMQYVAGKSLQERIDRTGPLPVEEIVRIGMQAARGLEAAHAVGLIHRDIKPSNILLENGVERVKLVDFGLARAADDASLTQSGVVAGTPQYMSPEQAGGEPVDHRADLFSLGSVLYALCTGRPPFRAESTMAVLRRVSDDTPRPIRELNPDIPDWLEAIITRLHAKDPTQRFQTAAEVAHLLGRCLAYLREPKRGEPPYPVERPKRPRKRRVAIAAVGLLALVALGAAGSDFVATVLRIRTPDGTMVIKVNDPDVKVKVDGEDVVISGAGLQELRVKPGRHTVESAKGDWSKKEYVVIERGGKKSVEVGFEPDAAIGMPGGIAMPGGGGPPRPKSPASSAVPPLAPYCQGWLRPTRPGSSSPDPDASPAEALSIAFAPDGRRLAVAGRIQKKPGENPAAGRGLLGLMEPDKSTLRILASAPAPIRAVAFSPDGNTVATGEAVDESKNLGDERMPIYESATLRDAATGAVIRGFRHQDDVNAVAFSPDNRFLATACEDGHLQVFDVATGRSIGTGVVNARLGGANFPAVGVAFAPDGRRLFTWTRDGSAGLWTFSRTQKLHPDYGLQITDNPVACAAFSPDGEALATGARDGSITLWDVRTGKPSAALRKQGSAAVTALAFSPDGRLVASAGSVGTSTAPGRGTFVVKLWSVASKVPVANLEGPNHRITSVAFAPDGKSIAAASQDGTVQLWQVPAIESQADPFRASPLVPQTGRDLARAAELPALPRSVHRPDEPVRPTPDALGADPFARADAAPRPTPRPVSPRRTPAPDAPRDPFEPIAPREDAGGLAVARRALPDGARPKGEADGSAVLALAASPDGKTFATGSEDGVVRILDVASRKVIRELKGHSAPVRSVAYSPSGAALASAASDQAKGRAGEVIIWTVADGRPTSQENLKVRFPLALAFAPDGKAFAVSGWDGATRLRHLSSGSITTLHDSQGRPARALAFAPDGKSLASGGDDGTIEIWKPEGGRVRTLPGNGQPIAALTFAPDGKTLAAGAGRSVILLDLNQGIESGRTILTLRKCEVLAVAFSPDGKSLAAGGGNVAARDGLTEIERKIKMLEEARLDKEKEVKEKRNAIKEQQKAHGNIEVAGAKDRNTVTFEEYRQLSSELLRLQIEIVKAEAQLAQLQAEQPAAAAERRDVTEADLTRLFYSDKRVTEARARVEAAEDKFKVEKERHRNLADPAVQRPMKDMKEAKADLDALWKEMKPQLEALARRGIKEVGGAENPLKATEAQLAALKAQELGLTDKLNTLNIRQRAEGAAVVSLEFDRMDLNRAEQYLDTISRNLAELKFQAPVAKPAEDYQSLAELRVWDVASGRQSRGLIEAGGWINALAFTRDGLTVIAGGGTPGTPGFATLFDLGTPAAEPVLPDARPAPF